MTAADIAAAFGPPISTYTRAQAIEDGFLVDVSETPREAGFKIPVALTRTVWPHPHGDPLAATLLTG